MVFLAGLSASALAMTALVGAGMLRNGPVWLVALAAVCLVTLPPRALAGTSKKEERGNFLGRALSMLVWSMAVLIVFPLYFPKERQQSISLGLAALEPFGHGYINKEWAEPIHEWLPQVNGTRVPPKEAKQTPVPKPPPAKKNPAQSAPLPLPTAVSSGDEVVLPAEGGRGSLNIPVTVENGRRSAEVRMIFDTGATLTTLDRSTLRKIGVRVPDDAPKMMVHTAAGPRETRVVLIERVWIGGYEVEGVTISVCDACATGDAVGLLGMNVSERFLVTVDGARDEVKLSPRDGATNRGSDVGPWIDLDAEATRWPDGRTEVILEAENTSQRWIERLTIAIQCDETRYADIRGIGPGQVGQVEVSVAPGTNCESFQVSIDSAEW
jgi:clan AA aspartic protease (TIGR02281 family)